jgi:hypothetical protein
LQQRDESKEGESNHTNQVKELERNKEKGLRKKSIKGKGFSLPRSQPNLWR